MSTLAELVRSRTGLDEADVAWLHRLVAEWQLIADLSFADLVLRVRTTEGSWLAVALVRPVTGPTTYPLDVVGSELGAESAGARRAQRAVVGRAVGDPTSELRGGRQVRSEAVPVRRGDRVVAVLARDTDSRVTRMPSPLELTYLTTAGELLQMVSEGRFPFPGAPIDPENAPRVGDGLIRLDRTGHVVYASPNALSATRRLGLSRDLLGAHLGKTIARLNAAPGRLDEPRGSAALAAVLRFGEPREAEAEAQGTTVLLRALPLFPAGEPRGALVLLRDVTELRSRERALVGKDATIREIHHRVKNNLQTVAALLRLQARRMDVPEARAALEESVRRVASIAMVHETLSRAWDEVVAFDEIADRVLAMCAEVAAPESSVQVLRSGSFGSLPAGTATAIAMVLTELAQNAVEHGWPVLEGRPAQEAGSARGGVVRVHATREAGVLCVRVDDDGAGLPVGFDLDAGPRLGLKIARTLVEGELRGSLRLQAGPGGVGASASVEVPVSDGQRADR